MEGVYIGWFRPLGSPRWYAVVRAASAGACWEKLHRYKAGYQRCSRVVLPLGVEPGPKVAPPGRSPSVDC